MRKSRGSNTAVSQSYFGIDGDLGGTVDYRQGSGLISSFSKSILARAKVSAKPAGRSSFSFEPTLYSKFFHNNQYRFRLV